MEDFDADLLEALLAGAEVKCPGAENNTPPFLTLPKGGGVGGAEEEGENNNSGVGANAEREGSVLADGTGGDRQVDQSAATSEERRKEPVRDSEHADQETDQREPPTPPAKSGGDEEAEVQGKEKDAEEGADAAGARKRRRKDRNPRRNRPEPRGKRSKTGHHPDEEESSLWGSKVFTADHLAKKLDRVVLTDLDRSHIEELDFPTVLDRAVHSCAKVLSVLRYTQSEVCVRYQEAVQEQDEKISALGDQMARLSVEKEKVKEEADKEVTSARKEVDELKEKVASAEQREADLQKQLAEFEEKKAKEFEELKTAAQKEIDDLKEARKQEVEQLNDARQKEIDILAEERSKVQLLVDSQQIRVAELEDELRSEKEARKVETDALKEKLKQLPAKLFDNCVNQVKVLRPDFPVELLSKDHVVTKDGTRIMKMVVTPDRGISWELFHPVPDQET
jgi:hypothetical protein